VGRGQKVGREGGWRAGRYLGGWKVEGAVGLWDIVGEAGEGEAKAGNGRHSPRPK
jgi:hypothetical protein